MEFNSPSTVNLVCLNIYNTVQLKIETSISAARRPESRRRRRRRADAQKSAAAAQGT